MNDTIEACERDEDDIFAREVTDAALEAGAGAAPLGGGAFTVNLCTVMADCST